MGNRSHLVALFACQGIALTLAALAFALLPPGTGPILLVPMQEHGAARMLNEKLRLMGPGRLPGSLIVNGEHPSFISALTEHGVLVLPALPVLCGGAPIFES